MIKDYIVLINFPSDTEVARVNSELSELQLLLFWKMLNNSILNKRQWISWISSIFLFLNQSGFPDDEDESPATVQCQSPRKVSRKAGENNSRRRRSTSPSSLSSSSDDTSELFSSVASGDSQGSDLERNEMLMKEEFQKYLNEPLNMQTGNSVLSKSF